MAPLTTPPTYTLTVLYARSPNTHFNLTYYLSHHISLAEKHWSSFGMTFHSVTPYSSPDGDYHLTAVMHFTDEASYQAALADAGTKIVMEDVESGRFTDVKPVFLGGTVVS